MSKFSARYFLILILLISVCLQLFAAHQKSFWEDEAFVAASASPDTLVICGEGDYACFYYSQLFGFGGYTPGDFKQQFSNKPSETWRFQINLSAIDMERDVEQAALSDLSTSYSASTTRGFDEQDPGIRRLKKFFLKQDDYQYRVVLYHSFNP